MDIKEALSKLDVQNDEHWTTDGQPRLDVMKEVLGSPVSRADISNVVKGFSRKTPNTEIEKPENTGSGEIADEKAKEPEVPENTQAPVVPETPEEPSEEHNEVDADVAIEKELEEATEVLNKAKARYNKANTAMDAVIVRRSSAAANGREPAHDIKAYQASQAKQREARSKVGKVKTQLKY